MRSVAQGIYPDIALHTLGWKSFQDLCAQIAEEIIKRPVELFREAQDGGQDAVFLSKDKKGKSDSLSATIQCKFSSKPGKLLKISDLKREDLNVKQLVNNGEADTYIFMTNMSVDAPVAVVIKQRLREMKVSHPHVFGKEWLTRAIRSSSRLRALVPRVYGLGDLSTILDERRAAQTQALLGHMLPTLQLYVTTKPHAKAIRSLSDHGIVLLLGGPGTGKSTIAAVLTTLATEKQEHSCYKIDGPEDLPDNWNPNENQRLYWIDDAFGPNQLREDYVDRWISIFPKIQAAIALGNRFILTSRTHIYQAASPKLGSRNHPYFRDSQAIVEVGMLSRDEKRQILYNHIKCGSQSASWKKQSKPFLDTVTAEANFLSEIARRLGDRSYTQHLKIDSKSITAFVREPREHLLQTIRELSNINRAVLSLIFLHRSKMNVGAISEDLRKLIMSHYSVSGEDLANAMLHLQDSFIVQRVENSRRIWTFKHPTIADALGVILGESENMAELYVRGVESTTILTEVVSVDIVGFIDGVVIPEALNEILAERLLEIPDDYILNRLLYNFIANRASDNLFRMIIRKSPGILNRLAYQSNQLSFDPKTCAYARARKLGLLANSLRQEWASRLERAIIEDYDTSFLDNEGILAILYPLQLIGLLGKIRQELLPKISYIASCLAEDADLELEPEDIFDDLSSASDIFEDLFSDDTSALELIEAGKDSIQDGIREVTVKKEAVPEPEEDTWDWEHYEAGSRKSIKSSAFIGTGNTPNIPRSIFSDVDE